MHDRPLASHTPLFRHRTARPLSTTWRSTALVLAQALALALAVAIAPTPAPLAGQATGAGTPTPSNTAAESAVDPVGNPDAPLIVGVKEAPPFAFRSPDGEWTGVSLDLVDAIARETGLEWELRAFDGLDALLGATVAGDVDVAAGAITLTAEREARLDFTHPFYSTGLALAVRTEGGGSAWAGVLRQFLSLDFLKVVALWGGILLLVGFLVWVFEHRQNDEFSEASASRGILQGFWFSAVTMTTVGYGDKAPRTLGGRLVTLVWMFAALIMISSFTAAIASSLTLGGLQGPIQGPGDLPGHAVGTVRPSTSAAWLDARDLRAVAFPTVSDALEGLAIGDVDAVVYDAPLLKWRIQQDDRDQLTVLPGVFEAQHYGFALPENSPHREALNRALLEYTGSAAWERVIGRYLGE